MIDLPAADARLHAAEIDEIERQILFLALEATRSRHGAIFLWTVSERALRIDFHVVNGTEVQLPHEVVLHKRGRRSGIAFHVAETNTSMLVNDTAKSEHYAGYFLEVRAIAAVPIPYQDKAIGVISVSADHTNAYTEADVAQLEALAAQCAHFLRRAQLYRWGKERGEGLLIKGLSPEWHQVDELIERVSGTRASVLIRGESGTGKELVAHAIHFNSPRRAEPFVTINCAAIPEQLLESILFGHVKGAFTGAEFEKVGEMKKADGGTLFLDELGELSPALQAKLLRALNSGEVHPVGSNAPPSRVDVRVLAATNRPLEEMMAKGTFREDLYFRIAVVTIRLPPLRTYLDNLEVLCASLVERANEAYDKRVVGLSAGAIAALRRHDFPGNIRELRNIIDHGVLLARTDVVEAEDLPPIVPRPTVVAAPREARTLSELRKVWMGERERDHLMRTLDGHDGDVVGAARELGLDKSSLYRLMKRYGIRLRTQAVLA